MNKLIEFMYKQHFKTFIFDPNDIDCLVWITRAGEEMVKQEFLVDSDTYTYMHKLEQELSENQEGYFKVEIY
jgi:hypothetical protein|tara:strand:- start:5984 stop:6199 length:216 start_codon:yes stop_codon:yes gene_type:complete